MPTCLRINTSSICCSAHLQRCAASKCAHEKGDCSLWGSAQLLPMVSNASSSCSIVLSSGLSGCILTSCALETADRSPAAAALVVSHLQQHQSQNTMRNL